MRQHRPSHYDVQALLTRLFEHRFIDPVTECWIWTGSRVRGYGHLFFTHKGKRHGINAHRLIAWVYLGHGGDRKRFVCHRCNVKACFNPAHLYIATPQQNVADALRDGLIVGHRRGVTHYEARFTEDQVREIRRIYASGTVGVKRLAKQFKVHRSTMHDIVKRRTWKHITEETLQ